MRDDDDHYDGGVAYLRYLVPPPAKAPRLPVPFFPTTYWCALSGVCVYDPVSACTPAEAAVGYVRRTLLEGWEARPYVRRLSGNFMVRVLGEGPAGVGAETPAEVQVEWAVTLTAGSDVPCVVFAQAVP